MKAYKLFRQRKDGSLGPLFIDQSLKIELGKVYHAEAKPTKGYAVRPGFHMGHLPSAPHLTEKGRLWVECEIPDFEYTPDLFPSAFSKVGDMKIVPAAGFYRFKRPSHQGGYWLISGSIRPVRILSKSDINEILNERQEAHVI